MSFSMIHYVSYINTYYIVQQSCLTVLYIWFMYFIYYIVLLYCYINQQLKNQLFMHATEWHLEIFELLSSKFQLYRCKFFSLLCTQQEKLSVNYILSIYMFVIIVVSVIMCLFLLISNEVKYLCRKSIIMFNNKTYRSKTLNIIISFLIIVLLLLWVFCHIVNRNLLLEFTVIIDMTRPKQDTRIKNFLTLFEPLRNKDSSSNVSILSVNIENSIWWLTRTIITENLCHKETTREDIIMDTTSIYENSKGRRECLKNQQLEDTIVNDNNTIKEDFPWLPKFSKVIRSSIGSRNYQHLERSLLLYTQ